MNKKKIDIKIILCGLALIIIVTTLFIKFTNSKKEKDNAPVNHKIVENLYEDNNESNCTEVIKITQNIEVSNVNDKVLLYLIFGQMKKDEVIEDTISIDDYRTSALKIMDEEYIPQKFEYIYEGYKYTLKENITRKKAKTDKNYVTKIFGYSGTDNLEVDVMAGYVKDGKVYDLNDNEIGTYSEDDINSILDKGTMQVYNYKKINDNYKLVSIGIK